MRRFAISGALAVSISLAAAACATSERVIVGRPPGATGDTSATQPSAQSAESFCSAMCTRVKACDKALDQQTCENTCTNQNAAVFPRLRGDVVDLIVACFEEKDCKTVLGGTIVKECTSDALASVAPSAAATAFCDDLAKKKKSCNETTTALSAKADCLGSAKLYDDDAIAQAKNCTDRACTETDACVAAVFGGLGGGSTTTTTTGGSCSGQFTELGACTSCAQTSCCTETTACYASSSCRSIVTTCMSQGLSSSSCATAYSGVTTATQQAASAVFGCVSSKCSGTTCKVN